MRLTSTALGACLVALAGCDDHEPAPQGKVSQGPSESSERESEARVRLSYDPGSPLDTARVAERIRARVVALGLERKGVEIGGKNILVEIAKDKLPVVKSALDEGRLDVHLSDARGLEEDSAEEPFEIRSETIAAEDGGPRPRGYLVGPPDKAEELARAAVQMSGGGSMLSGPLFSGSDAPKWIRSYRVDPGESIRGEHLTSASPRQQGSSAILELRFTGAGKSSLRWASKKRGRFVLRIDGQVLSTVQPDQEIDDGKLSFVIEPRASLESTLGVAKKLGELLHERAMSHVVKLDAEQPIP